MDQFDSYNDNLFNKRQLGPIGSTTITPYVIALCISKFLHCFGLYVAYEQLKIFRITQFLFIARLVSSVVLVLLQKPVSSGKKVTPNQWYRVCRHAIFSTIIALIWLQGLTLCGALRTVLLFEHSELTVLGALGVLFHTGVAGPSKARGSILFLLGILSLLLFDNDAQTHGTHGSHNEGSGRWMHMYYHTLSMLGLPDHKGGLILLLLGLLLNVGHCNLSRKLAVEIGGAKRLTALSTIISCVISFPLAVISYYGQESSINWLSSVLPMALVIFFVFILDFYVESFCLSKLETAMTAKVGSISSFIGALFFALLWDQPWAWTVHEWHHGKAADSVEKHLISGGTIFSALFFILATRLLCRPSPRPAKGNLIGYTTGGLPIYNFHTPQSIMSTLRTFLRQTLEESESRQIFYFLCLNLFFTGVELAYGVWTNSLGLISDGFHMLFDCTALVLGLCAALMSRWKQTRTFSYGFGRVEILSGFVNGLFLVVIAFFVFVAALQRIFDPPKVSTERLLVVSVLGLVVNLVGIFAFRHAHAHSHGGGGSSHGHSHHDNGNHGHSHHGHSHHGHSHSSHPDRSVNMEGVFLHVVADTLGSVGVIVSSILIERFGLFIADPVCSLFIAIMIFLSVLPLLRESSYVLLQRTPIDIEKPLSQILNKVLSLDGVLSYRDHHFWQHSEKTTVGTLHVQVAPSASEQKIIQQVNALLKEYGVNDLSIQVEKEAFFHHMSALSAGYKSVLALKQGSQIGQPPSDTDLGFIKSI